MSIIAEVNIVKINALLAFAVHQWFIAIVFFICVCGYSHRTIRERKTGIR